MLDRKPKLGERESIAEQMPLTQEEIKQEISNALSEIGKNHTDIDVRLSDNTIFLEISKNDDKIKTEELNRSLSELFKTLEARGYAVKWVYGAFDEHGSGDMWEVKDN